MKKYCIGNETLELDSNREKVKLVYYVLEDENEEKDYKEYGVEIEKQDKFRVEKSRVIDITTDFSKINYIINLLMKNAVTPVHLHDIIEDII